MRTGNIWRWFMQNREVRIALQRVELFPKARTNVGSTLTNDNSQNYSFDYESKRQK